MLRLGSKLGWLGLLRLTPAGGSPAAWPVEYDAMAADLMPMSLRAMAREGGAAGTSLARAGERRTLGDRPLIVLSAGNEQTAGQLEMMKLRPEHGRLLLQAALALHREQASAGAEVRLEARHARSRWISN